MDGRARPSYRRSRVSQRPFSNALTCIALCIHAELRARVRAFTPFTKLDDDKIIERRKSCCICIFCFDCCCLVQFWNSLSYRPPQLGGGVGKKQRYGKEQKIGRQSGSLFLWIEELVIDCCCCVRIRYPTLFPFCAHSHSTAAMLRRWSDAFYWFWIFAMLEDFPSSG